MTHDQEAHLGHILHEAADLISTKYRAGQKEHGGDLWEMPMDQLLDNAIEEAVDQLVFLLTMKQEMRTRGLWV